MTTRVGGDILSSSGRNLVRLNKELKEAFHRGDALEYYKLCDELGMTPQTDYEKELYDKGDSLNSESVLNEEEQRDEVMRNDPYTRVARDIYYNFHERGFNFMDYPDWIKEILKENGIEKIVIDGQLVPTGRVNRSNLAIYAARLVKERKPYFR